MILLRIRVPKSILEVQFESLYIPIGELLSHFHFYLSFVISSFLH